MSRPRILLVDDDRRVRQLVGLTLPADDYELAFAEDGTDALNAIRRLHPDLILLDYAMPGLHGVDVCTAIRSNPEVADTPIIMVTGHSDDETRQRALAAGANGFLTKPFSPLALEQTIRAMLGGVARPMYAPTMGRSGSERDRASAPVRVAADGPAGPVELPAGRSLEVARHRYSELHETLLPTIEALATALERRTAAPEGHAQRVSLFTAAAARRLGVAPDELEQLRWGAILHDVGMVAVPDAILMRAGPLRPEEWALVRRHPDEGARLLQHISGLGSALAIVRFHHERFDGAGYPFGLRGTAIPLGARVFAVADALDAITTPRPYRPTRTWEQARVEILRGRGSHFDPTVVDVFLEIFDDLQGLTAAEHPEQQRV